MQKKEFIRQLNELVPRPDPVTTEALYRFDRECAESEYIDMLTALRVVARNFSGETLQGAYELIQHQNAALPSEMFAAAVCLQAGRTPAEVSQLAVKGALMGFFGPERPEEPSRTAPPWPPISPVMRIWVSRRWPVTRCGWSEIRARRPCSGCEKTAGYYGHTVVCCVPARRKGGRTMNDQRRQDMYRDPVEGRLPFGSRPFLF